MGASNGGGSRRDGRTSGRIRVSHPREPGTLGQGILHRDHRWRVPDQGGPGRSHRRQAGFAAAQGHTAPTSRVLRPEPAARGAKQGLVREAQDPGRVLHQLKQMGHVHPESSRLPLSWHSSPLLEAEPGRVPRQRRRRALQVLLRLTGRPPPIPTDSVRVWEWGGTAPLRGRSSITPAQGEAAGGGGPGRAADVNLSWPSTAGATSPAPDKRGATLPPSLPLSLQDHEWLPPLPFRPPEASPRQALDSAPWAAAHGTPHVQ